MCRFISRWIFTFYITTMISHSSVAFSVSSFLSNLKDTIHYYSVSPFSEQCDERWVVQDIHGLEGDLDSYVFGQEMVSDVVLAALRTHLEKQHRKKPLVLFFHGWPGGGKGYVADFIVKNWFKTGVKSRFVKKYLAKISFPLESKVYEYQRQLQDDLENTVRKCSRAMFLFDEVDKYPPHVLDGIKSYLDYNTHINGVDFRKAIFIFITNTGDKHITNIVLEKRKQGIRREMLKLQDFENVLKTTSFNDEGGLHHSDIIKHHLIDVVVPFLPLERHHIELCIQAEVLFQGGSPDLIKDITSEVIEEMSFGPVGEELYSRSGCKRVSEKVASILERLRRRSRTEF